MKHQAVRAIVLSNDRLLTMHRNKFGHVYSTLVGGGIEPGETPEAALRRELHEETGMSVGAVRLVFIEDAGELYGEQLIYTCEYIGGEPKLSGDSEEAAASKLGEDLYSPRWLALSELPQAVFRSSSVKAALLNAFTNGFPETPQRLAWRPESVA